MLVEKDLEIPHHLAIRLSAKVKVIKVIHQLESRSPLLASSPTPASRQCGAQTQVIHVKQKTKAPSNLVEALRTLVTFLIIS